MNNNSQITPPHQFEIAEVRCGRCNNRQVHLHDANACQSSFQADPSTGSGLYLLKTAIA